MPDHPHAVAGLGSPLDLLAFATLGLLGGGAHCVGMCAPFVLLVSRRFGAAAGRSEAGAQLWYSAGRLTTYVALGAAAGAAGGLVQQAGAFIGLQRTAAVMAGALLVVSAGGSLIVATPFAAPSRAVGRLTTRLMTRVPGHPVILGGVLGLLPCGLLYSAVVAATTTGGALAGGLAMATFGLGTAPALAGVAVANRVVVSQRVGLTRLSSGFVLAMGVWYLWRGVGPLAPH
jgi:hypothetical protein